MKAPMWALEVSDGARVTWQTYPSDTRAEQAARRLSRRFSVRRFVALSEPEYRTGMERPGWRAVSYFAGVES